VSLTHCILQELKDADVAELESLRQDAMQNNNVGVNKLEHHLLNKYCAAGVCVLMMLVFVICALFCYADITNYA